MAMTHDERLAKLSREELAFFTQRGWKEGEPREVCDGGQPYRYCEALRRHGLMRCITPHSKKLRPSYLWYVLSGLGVDLMPAAQELFRALAAFEGLP